MIRTIIVIAYVVVKNLVSFADDYVNYALAFNCYFIISVIIVKS